MPFLSLVILGFLVVGETKIVISLLGVGETNVAISLLSIDTKLQVASKCLHENTPSQCIAMPLIRLPEFRSSRRIIQDGSSTTTGNWL